MGYKIILIAWSNFYISIPTINFIYLFTFQVTFVLESKIEHFSLYLMFLIDSWEKNVCVILTLNFLM